MRRRKWSNLFYLREGQKDWSIWLPPIIGLLIAALAIYDMVGHDLGWL